jgi:hypothetical protein
MVGCETRADADGDIQGMEDEGSCVGVCSGNKFKGLKPKFET